MSARTGGERGSPLAPVIPLFGGEPAAAAPVVEAGSDATPASTWRTSWSGEGVPATLPEADESEDATEARADAEAALLRKLRTRSLSVREARAVLADHGLDAHAADGILDEFQRRGYLDDARLAEQLVHSGVERKGQGRQAIGRTLSQRGVPREVADLAVADLADDDADRALEFARTKARSMGALDHDVALRRLVGQLARRGYGAEALPAARQALDEAGISRSGVRFR